MQTLPENLKRRPAEEEEATTKKAMMKPEWQCGMENDEEDTETHGAIHTREAYEKLSIVYEKVREGCHYDISCVRRYHFDFEFFITIHLKLHNSSRTAKSHDKALTGNAITQIDAAVQSTSG